jgi:glycosyltransferase involved in cell wall biosynthesis
MAEGALMRATRSVQEGADKKILLVSGSYPPDVCGVGNYTERLLSAASGWQVLVERDWSVKVALRILRRLLKRRPSTIILQYPTQGYGWSLVPHLLVVFGALTKRYRSVLALHEFGSLSKMSRLALSLTSHFAHHVVFTAEAERGIALAHPLFSREVPTSIVAILSNIKTNVTPPAFGDRSIDIAYFGHIRPRKGLEDFLDTVGKLRQASPELSAVVFGQVPAGYEDFAEAIVERCRQLGCEVAMNLDNEAASRALSDVRILYLPYPDGISPRRGTALAGFASGAIVATRVGPATPEAIIPAIIACPTAGGDAAVLQHALKLSPEDAELLQRAGRNYLEKALPRDWGHVAELYEQAVNFDRAVVRPAERGPPSTTSA